MAHRLRFNAVVRLDVSNSFITGRVPPFDKLGGLTALLDSLKVSESLTVLNMSYCNLFGEGARLVAAMMRQNKTVTALDLAQNDIGPAGAEHVLRMVGRVAAGQSVLHTLDVTMNNIPPPLKKKLVERSRHLHRLHVNKH